jgi:uncharacterized membrane protein YfcA
LNEIQIFTGFTHVLQEVAMALIPLAIIFLFLQIWLLKFPKQRVINILKGLFLTFIGLSFFLQSFSVVQFHINYFSGADKNRWSTWNRQYWTKNWAGIWIST